MALQKNYQAKVYDQDGTSRITTFTFSPEGENTLKNLPTFRSTINGGLGEMVLDLNLPFDDFDEGNSINFMNVVDLWVTDLDHPRGRRIYRGCISRYEPYIDGEEGVRVTCLGLVSLLTESFYKSGSDFEVAHSSQDPTVIAKAIIDHFNTIYGGSLITYDADSIPATVGAAPSLTFTDQRWADAIQKTIETAGTNWWWHVDENGKLNMKAKPGTATHTFTLGKDVESVQAPKDSEGVVNDVQVRGDGGSTTNASDGTSQATYGTGSSPTGKRSVIVSDGSLTDSTAETQRANKELNDNKDAKVKGSFVVNTNYDLESVKVGDTCQVKNLKYGNDFFPTVMLIVSVAYEGDRCQVEVEEQATNLGKTLVDLIGDSNQSSGVSGGGSGGGGGSTSSDEVSNEVPSGAVNDVNLTFTLSQTPIAGTVRLYLNGQRQYPSTDFGASGATLTLVVAPPTGATLIADYLIVADATAVYNEGPAGAVDGVNDSFTLANTPTTDSVKLYLNGQRQYPGTDYGVSGDTITMVVPPPTGATLLADYSY